jgi:hypothetical protein
VAAALTLNARRAVFLIQTNRELGAWRVAVRVDQ